MADIKVAVINESETLKDDEVRRIIPALQKQVHRDFAPVWGVDADLDFFPSGAQPPAGWWWLAIHDDSDRAEEIGYHETTAEGLPLGKVFARTAADNKVNWTVTTSHELLEMLADPGLNLTVFFRKRGVGGTLYQHEVCDPCQADKFGYEIDRVMVSDFVYPAWFETFRARHSTKFDHKDHLKGPAPKLLPGGFIRAFDIESGRGWRQIENHGRAVGARRVGAPAGSRRHRRDVPRNRWRRSEVKFGLPRSRHSIAQEDAMGAAVIKTGNTHFGHRVRINEAKLREVARVLEIPQEEIDRFIPGAEAIHIYRGDQPPPRRRTRSGGGGR
jgi:hypothetical protein